MTREESAFHPRRRQGRRQEPAMSGRGALPMPTCQAVPILVGCVVLVAGCASLGPISQQSPDALSIGSASSDWSVVRGLRGGEEVAVYTDRGVEGGRGTLRLVGKLVEATDDLLTIRLRAESFDRVFQIDDEQLRIFVSDGVAFVPEKGRVRGRGSELDVSLTREAAWLVETRSGGHLARRGALIGAIPGCAFGFYFWFADSSDTAELNPLGSLLDCAYFALPGAGIGAIVGLAFKDWAVVYRRPPGS